MYKITETSDTNDMDIPKKKELVEKSQAQLVSLLQIVRIAMHSKVRM
jgi:hypothetical protein